MKNLMTPSVVLLIFMAFFVTQVQAQRVKGNGKLIQKTRNVDRFDQIGVAGSFDVFLVSGDAGRIELEVEENLEPYLETIVEDGSLKIRWKRGANVKTNKKTTLTVHFDQLSVVALSGSGKVVTRDAIKTEDLKVALAGSGDVDLALKAGSVVAALSGSGDVSLKGSANSFEAAVAGSGDIKAYELLSKQADLKISGSGSIHAHASEKVKAVISGSGDIKYKGNPDKEDVKVSGSGKVSAS